MRNAIAALGLVVACASAQPERFVLDNGATVVLDDIPGAGRVAIIAAYDTGFISDPAGLPQAAHLSEHLRCTSATDSWESGQSFARLNELGSANAETLASLTYYDFTLPPEQLGLGLRVEAERLSSLRVTAADIQREGPRAAAELTGVDSHPQRLVGKFALMAIAQGWTHNAGHVNLRTALGRAPIGALRPGLERHAPQSLTLVLVGDFDPAEATRLIADSVGAVPRADPLAQPPAIDWDAQPALRRMTWDASTRVVAIACSAPDDAAQRTLLTGLGMVAHMTCTNVPGVLSLHTSGQTAPVGPTPFHVVAAIDDDADPQRVINDLHDRLDAMIKNSALYRSQLVMTLSDPPMDAKQLKSQVQALARMRSMSEEHAMGMALGNMALQSLMRERAGGDRMGQAIRQMSADQLRNAASGALGREHRRVTILSPRAPDPRP